MKLKKLTPNIIGLIQSLGVIVYCALIACFFWSMDRLSGGPPAFAGITLMLFLLVFSAGITGLMVFGYAIYLAINKNIRRALEILAYTFLYSLLIIIIIMSIVLI